MKSETRRRIVRAHLMPAQPHARPDSARYELTLECGHTTWRNRYDLQRGGKLAATLLCRTCARQAQRAVITEEGRE